MRAKLSIIFEYSSLFNFDEISLDTLAALVTDLQSHLLEGAKIKPLNSSFTLFLISLGAILLLFLH